MRSATRAGAELGTVERVSSGPVQHQATGRLSISTRGAGFTDLTCAFDGFVAESGVTAGLATILCRHTSASLTIQENADETVRSDLLACLDRLAPRDAAYLHDTEGPDDMPAHIRTMLTSSTLSIPVLGGRLDLGIWQAIYLVEHRDSPKIRQVTMHVIGS